MSRKLKPMSRFENDVRVGDLVRIVLRRSSEDARENLGEYTGYLESCAGTYITLSINREGQGTMIYSYSVDAMKYEILRRAKSS